MMSEDFVWKIETFIIMIGGSLRGSESGPITCEYVCVCFSEPISQPFQSPPLLRYGGVSFSDAMFFHFLCVPVQE